MKEPLEVISIEDDVLILSFDSRLLETVGQIEDVDLPEEGDEIEQGQDCIVIHGSEDKLEIRAPISGLILEVNDSFLQDISKKPKNHTAQWLIKIEANDPDDLFKFEE
ncbi:MAG: hypothetical protein HY390_01390 [Deltaproteobacteria bacterium]|nr:hypothetical protein [Deltaproteobacteria bacterium]